MPEVSLGNAIGLTATPLDRTQQVIGEIDRQRKEEGAIVAASRKAAIKHQSDIEKYRNDLGKWTIGQESGIHPVYHEKLAAKAEEMRQLFNEGIQEHGNAYNPNYDRNLQKKKFEFAQEVDKDKQSTKNIVRDLSVKANDKKDNYNINEGLLNSLNIKDYNEFVKANGGSDYYSLGLNSPKPELLSWTKDAATFAQKMKGLYVKNPDGSKTINPKLFDEQWDAIKTDPSAKWVQNGMAVNASMGFTPDQSEEQIKHYVKNLLPNQPAPDVSSGAGTGRKAKYDFSQPTLHEVTLASGDKNNFYSVNVIKKGGGALPADFFENDKGQQVFGHPTGGVKQYEKTGKVIMDLAIPDKSITSSSEWRDMDDTEREQWLQKEYEKDPNKFKKEEVPLGGSNKNKFESSFGKSVDQIFGQKSSKEKNTSEEKVVVEKDGKKYRLPKAQLGEATKQGYKLSK